MIKKSALTRPSEKIQKTVQINVEFIQLDQSQTSDPVNQDKSDRSRIKQEHFVTDYNFCVPINDNIIALLETHSADTKSQYSLCIEASQWNKDW